jgi:hypothetical protein
MPARHVEPAQAEEEKGRWQHEQRPRCHAALCPVQPPTKPGRKLMRLGSRQEHAKIQLLREIRLSDSPTPLDEFAVHDRNLPGGAAESNTRELLPKPHRLAEKGLGSNYKSLKFPYVLRFLYLIIMPR